MKKHTIVCISGKQGSGKTTLAKKLIEKYSGTHMKFAGPLYEMHEAIRGVLTKYGCDKMAQKDGELLQYLGTEFGRNRLGRNIWVDLIANAIHDTIDKLEKWSDKAFIVVDDARFENELDMFLALKKDHHEWNIITVRLTADEVRRKLRAEGWRDDVNHRSEIALDGRVSEFDLNIETIHTPEDTFNLVVQAIEKNG